MTRDRAAKARSLLLAEHAARCAPCQDGASCSDGAELRRVLMRELDSAGGLDELARAQVTEALRPALERLLTFKHALRAALGERGLVPEEKTKTTPRRRRRSSNCDPES